MIRVLLIDDETIARGHLRNLLSEHKDELSIIGEAANGAEGAELIDVLKPDLVFLDIEMPILDGFEVLKRITHQPKVIFATAYDEFAVRAFEENSVDYLLKPIEAERLKRSIDRVVNSVINTQPQNIDTWKWPEKKTEVLKTITVKLGDRIFLVKTDDITYLAAQDKYVTLHTREGKSYLVDQSLSTLAIKLPAQFLQIHRAVIINQNFVQELRKSFNGSYTFILTGKTETRLKSGRSFLDSIRDKLNL